MMFYVDNTFEVGKWKMGQKIEDKNSKKIKLTKKEGDVKKSGLNVSKDGKVIEINSFERNSKDLFSAMPDKSQIDQRSSIVVN